MMRKPSIHDGHAQVSWRKSISARLSRMTVLVLIGSMVVLGAGLIWIARHAQQKSAVESLSKNADEVALLINRYVVHTKEELRLFIDTQHLESMPSSEQKTELEALLISSLPRFNQITLLDRDGRERLKVSRFHTFLPHELGSQADTPGFLTALKGTTFVSSVHVSPDSGLLSLQIALPVSAGPDVAVLTADVDIRRLWQEVSLTDIGRTGYAYLVDVRGRGIDFHQFPAVLNRYSEDMRRIPPVALFMAGVRKDAPRTQVYEGLKGSQVIGLYKPIPDTDWAVIVEMPTRVAYADVRKMQLYLLGLTFLGALAAGLLIFMVSRRLLLPISAVTSAAQHFRAKEWDASIPEVSRQDEVGILAQAFTRMRDELRDLYKNIEQQLLELRQSKEELEQSEARYRFLTEKMNDVIWITDLNFRFTYISPSVRKVLGFSAEEFMHKDPQETMSPESYSHALNLLASELDRSNRGDDRERNIKAEMQYRHKNGSLVWLEHAMSFIRGKDDAIIGIHGVSRDITERKHAEADKKRLEDQLVQARKMESIGTLAGGIAHNFNNILSAILGYTELAMNSESDVQKSRSRLKEVLKAADRARDLIRQILVFSHKTDTVYTSLDLCSVVKESLMMIRSIIPSTIEIRQGLSDSGTVMSDPAQIHQIMMNLCTNAVQAMEKGAGGGVLQVDLGKVFIVDREARSLDLSPGPFLKLSISDTGEGMTSQVMERIFDPYFTTKEQGRGTGLGLSVVHGIVKSHGGAIVCRSTPGEGTTFDVFLPEIDSPTDIVEHHDRDQCIHGSERILFVDDEPSLADLAEEMLSYLGYRMTPITVPAEALDLLMNDPYAFDLVITDMTMPGMRGDQLARKIMEIRHDMPIILCTGFSEHINEAKALEMGIRAFVLKPLKMRALSDTIRKVLDDK